MIGRSASTRKDGWGQSGTLTTGDPQPVSMQVDFAEAGTYTVQFNISNTAGTIVTPEALISWRVEGQEVTRRVSIGDGTSVTGVGQAVRVQMYDKTPAYFGAPGVKYNVSAQVSKGSRASTGMPPTLSPFNILVSGLSGGFGFTVTDGQTLLVPIPLDAGVTQVHVSAIDWAEQLPVPVAEVFARIINAYGTNQFFTLREWDTQVTTGWVPSAPGANSVALVNKSARYMAYYITFGIDG